MLYQAERRVGSTDPIRFRVEFDTPTDLGPLTKTFFMWGTDADRTRHVNGAAATATDISADETPPKPAQTVWVLEYQPGAGGFTPEGWHRAEFEVDYGGGTLRQYPSGHRFIEVIVAEHKGTAPTP